MDQEVRVNKYATPVRNVKEKERKYEASMTVGMGEQTDECVLIRKKTWCERHDCQVKRVIVTSKKWQWIKSKNCYGNVSSRVSKYLCKSKKSGRAEPQVPPAHLSMANNDYGGNTLVGRET